MDFVVEMEEMPKKGETILGKGMELIPGGKGANQAYAVGKLGGEVSMIGAVGCDIYGDSLIENLESVGVITSGIERMTGTETGKAIISVNKAGENSIVVLAGANGFVTKEMVLRHMQLLEDAKTVIMQLEIPLETAEYIAKEASVRGKLVILDPAPAPKKISDNLLRYIDVLKPNETELHTLTGMKTDTDEEIEKAARSLLDRGVKTVIVTMGAKGCMLVKAHKKVCFENEPVKAVDTTAAGDCFTAAFATAITKGESEEGAIRFANKASAIAVTRKGAQTSIPTAEEVNR